MGHEFLGVVEDIGSDVSGLKARRPGASPRSSGPTTPATSAAEGLQTSCRHGGCYGFDGVDGGQGEAVRVPQAQGTLVKLPVGRGLGAAAVAADPVRRVLHRPPRRRHRRRRPAATTVTVIGDGAVGLSAVLAAKRLGAERIILMGRHTDRTDLGREFGATDVVAERGEEGIAKVRELTGGDGTHAVLECVGTRRRPGHGLRRGPRRRPHRPGRRPAVRPTARSASAHVHAQHHPHRRRRPGPRLHRGTAARRARRHHRARPVFDRTVTLDEVPDGYRAMADREALKVLIRP